MLNFSEPKIDNRNSQYKIECVPGHTCTHDSNVRSNVKVVTLYTLIMTMTFRDKG